MNLTVKKVKDYNQTISSIYKIIGNGLIANAFKERSKIDSSYSAIIFASGVSNSLETNPYPFLREKELLMSVLKDKKKEDRFVYFSTLSIYDISKKNTHYIKHKLELEQFIVQHSENYIILRVPNIIGKGGNPTTLLNYLINSVRNDIPINILKNAYRNFIGVADLAEVVEKLIISTTTNAIIDLLHPVSYSMIEVMECVEKHVNKKAHSIYLEEGYNYFPLPNQKINSIFEESNISIEKNYLNQILFNYY